MTFCETFLQEQQAQHGQGFWYQAVDYTMVHRQPTRLMCSAGVRLATGQNDVACPVPVSVA